MDHNPWTFATPNDEGANPPSPDHSPLPLPPNPTDYRWKNRCYNCLEVGHDQNDCLSKDRVCARCWISGHQAKDCRHSMTAKRQRFDPLVPRGNLGESQLPPNRPESAIVFIPETQHINNTNRELTRAIIIDARLVLSHDTQTVQSFLMKACNTPIPLPLTHLADSRYLLLLAQGTDRDRFLRDHTRNMHELGLVPYPWSLANDATTLALRYKVWIELKRLSPNQWNLDHLIPAVSTFGVVLEHSTMQNVRSMQKMMVVLAMPDLAKIPKAILFWERGMLKGVEVLVHSWLEEPINFPTIVDTTPPTSIFDQVKGENQQPPKPQHSDSIAGDTISFGLDSLFDIWMSMPPGKAKDDIEVSLKKSPLFLLKKEQHAKAVLADLGLGTPVATPVRDEQNELDPQVLSATGVLEGRVIMRSINCDFTPLPHAQLTDSQILHETALSATGQVSPVEGQGLSDMGDFELTGLGCANPKNQSWADMVEEEENRALGLEVIHEQDINQNNKRPGKELMGGPVNPPSSPKGNSSGAGPSKKQGKRAKKRAAKKIISETELRRSVRISKNPGRKLYTPKKDSAPSEQAGQVALVAKTVEEAEILKALSDEVITLTPLLDEQLSRVNKFCAAIIENSNQGRVDSPAPAANVPLAPTVEIVPVMAEIMPPATVQIPEIEPIEEEPEEEPVEEEMEVPEEPEDSDFYKEYLDTEAALDQGESVLDDYDFDIDELDEEMGDDADLHEDQEGGGDASD